MKSANNRILAFSITLIFLLIMLFPLDALPSVAAHYPEWKIPTYAYIHVAPNPVGVGQQIFIMVWVSAPGVGPMPGSNMNNNIRYHNYKVVITKPDNNNVTVEWPVCVDTTSSAYYFYTPDMVGVYSFVFYYAGQIYDWSGQAYQNDTFLSSTSKTVTVTVQDEQVPPAITDYPLPTEYWTRPIEGQNTDWYSIASHWLGTGSPQLTGVWPNSLTYGRVVQDGVGPTSPHIMWAKPIQMGGVVGGNLTAVPGDTFYPGINYNLRFRNSIIMNGRLFYELPYENSGTGGGYVAVDLRTGKQLWWTNSTIGGVPSYGYMYDLQNPNQHGMLEGWLFTNNFARAYYPATGDLLPLNITNVPSGTKDMGPLGEELRYAITNIGTTAAPNWRLTQWNSSKVFDSQTSGTINASLPSRYDWNVSISGFGVGMVSSSIIAAFLDDIVLGRNGTMPAIGGAGAPYTMWAISMKPESRGQVVWMKNYDVPPNNVTIIQGVVDKKTRVFLQSYKETLEWVAYNLDDGSKVWGPLRYEPSDADYFEVDKYSQLYNGRMYSFGYSGTLFCLDVKTGKILWTYGNGGIGAAGNDTFTLNSPWGHWPMFCGAILGGKIYTYYTEHSPNSPLYKGAKVRCIDAEDGHEIWTLPTFGGTHASGTQFCGADGFLVYLDSYDMRIYCIGKGPSATKVSASPEISANGDGVMLQGTVTDIAAGTTQDEQAARFPNGVPAVSDESMSDWMAYVYMQKPRPTSVAGVTVSLDTIDPNGNYVHIANVTTDSSGMFKKMWIPEVPGEYNVIATFAGTESYWRSFAETAVGVSEAAATAVPYPETVLPPTEMYFAISTAVIVAAIVIVAAVMMLMLRKRA